MNNSFELCGTTIEVDYKVTCCGPQIQDITIGGESISLLIEDTPLEQTINDYVDNNYRVWLAEQALEEAAYEADRKGDELRDRRKWG